MTIFLLVIVVLLVLYVGRLYKDFEILKRRVDELDALAGDKVDFSRLDLESED